MNERIKLLAAQVGGEFFEGFAGSPNSIKFKEDEFQKFAELIIRECAEFCEDKNSKLLGTMLKEHFGVES